MQQTEMMETKIEEVSKSLKYDIALKHDDLRMAGFTDEQAGALILGSVKRLLPDSAAGPRAHASTRSLQ
jgi:uncharacterized protein YwbE